MATSGRFSDGQSDEINECSICVDTFQDQRCLPCLHTFCLECIKGHAAGKRVGQTILCPLCRKPFTIPRGGLDELPHNFWIDQLNRSNSSGGSRESISSAEIQRSAGEVARQSQYVAKLDSFTKITQTELVQLEHDQEKVFAETIESETKIKLRCAGLKRLIDEQETQLILQVTSFRENQLRAISGRRIKLENHLTNLEAFRRDSDVAFQRNPNSHSSNTLETRMKNLGMTQVSLNNDTLPSVDVAFTHSNPTESSTHLQGIIGKFNVNETKGKIQMVRSNPPLGSSSASVNWISGPASVGDGGQRNNPVTGAASKPFGSVRANFLSRIEIGGRVSGIAQLRGRIYVLCHSKIIRVYDAVTNARLPNVCVDTSETWLGWVVEKIVFQGQITACNIYDCLYVSDYFGKCVWQITDDGRKVVKWLQTDGPFPNSYFKMSVTSDGRVVMPANLPPRIDVYEPNARLSRTVPLPNNMAGTVAIETKYGNYVVGHEVSRFCSFAQVCEYSPEGERLRFFGAVTNDGGISQLGTPELMAINADGHILVADHAKNRIVLLDSLLKKCQVLLDVNLSHPKYLHVNQLCAWYDRETDRLVVCPKGEHLDEYSVRK